MKGLLFLLLALISAVACCFYAYTGVAEWNRGTEAADTLKAAYTGETKGQKVAQEMYRTGFMYRTTHYRATFVYEVDGKTYQAKTDTSIEPWDEEEVHYDIANPAQAYVGQYPPIESNSSDYFGPAVVALVIAIVFGVGALGFF